MASAPIEPRPVLGRLDRTGRLVSADPELEALQREAGSALGQPLALPQIAAVAELARKLRTSVARPALAASTDHDIELWVQARPEGDEIALSLEGWTARAPVGPRLAAILGGAEAETGGARNEWAADEELRIISLSSDLADLLGVNPDDVAGQALTRVLRLEEDDSGEMPLISALAARRSFTGQHARSRADDSRSIVLSGEVVSGADGVFAGFRGSVQANGAPPAAAPGRTAAFDAALDQVLRSPLDRIIESAERIVERADGPLRSDYASYGSDIAAAARHLLSVLTSMSEEQPQASQRSVDLVAVAAEAVVMLDSPADERRVRIEPQGPEALPASGEERAVTQILVNLIGNAIRHSPEGGIIRLIFGRTGQSASVSVCDEGPGIAEVDRERIFERFERAHEKEGGTGLGLAISRRLARSLGGDVTLDSAPGEGARFTLTLPAA
jgi:signal transduction histidine kinase